MNPIDIFSKNAAYQKFEVLKANRKKRHKYGEFIIEGVRNINEAIQNHWRINAFIYSRERALSRWGLGILHSTGTKENYALSDRLMKELSGKNDASELIAIASMEPPTIKELSENPIIALFDRPSNKGNLGTLIRSCDALGVERLVLTGHGVDVYDPEVIGSSMGSFFKVPFIKLSDNKDIDQYISALKRQWPNMKVIATTEQGQTAIYDLDMTVPVLLLIGNEKDGLNRRLEASSDVLAKIPMNAGTSASSFNVSCAATVVFYEVTRQRSLKCESSEIQLLSSV